MRIRTFRSPSFETARAEVRAALGDDALILETRQVEDGFEILAVLEAPEPLAGLAARPEPDAPPPLDIPPAAGSPLDARRRALTWHGIGGTLAERLAEHDLAHALTKSLRFGDVPLCRGARPLLFVGEPGAGKSLTMVKLATRLVLAGVRPLMISADGRKAGAVEQLATLTRLLGLELVVANEPRMLERALAQRVDGAPVLIDAPGADLAARGEEAALADLAGAVDAEPLLVLPGGLDPAETAEIAERHAAFGAVRMIATRLDVAKRIGGIVTAAFRSGLILTEAGNGPSVVDGLEPLTAALLARRVSLAPVEPVAAADLHDPATKPAHDQSDNGTASHVFRPSRRADVA